MASEPPPGILGGLVATVDAGRKLGFREVDLLSDVLHLAGRMAWGLGVSSVAAGAKLADIVDMFAAAADRRGKGGGRAD